MRARWGLRVRLRARRGRRRRGTRRVVARHVDAQLRELRGEVAGHGLNARVGREVGDDLRERAPDLRDRRGGRRVALRVAIHRRGLYIGLPSATELSPSAVESLKSAIVSFPFAPRHVTLITGASGLVGSALQAVVRGGSYSEAKVFVFANRTHADLDDAEATRELLAGV